MSSACVKIAAIVFKRFSNPGCQGTNLGGCFVWSTAMFCRLLFVFIAFTTSANAYGIDELKDTLSTVGYLKSQEYSIELIEKQYPELIEKAAQAQNSFNLSFGQAEKNIHSNLKKLLTEEKYNEDMDKFNQKIQDSLGAKRFTYNEANKFISEVNLRARGQIPSPFLEILLANQYSNIPEEEFLRGYTKFFNTKEHQKSSGLDMQIAVPVSWKAKEANNTNIVQKFISSDNEFYRMFAIQVMSIPDHEMQSEDEFRKSTKNNLSEILPSGAKLNNAQEILLVGKKGLLLNMDTTGKQMDKDIFLKNLWFIFFQENNMVSLQFSIGALNSNSNLEEEFQRYTPLFKIIANSTTFPISHLSKTKEDKGLPSKAGSAGSSEASFFGYVLFAVILVLSFIPIVLIRLFAKRSLSMPISMGIAMMFFLVWKGLATSLGAIPTIIIIMVSYNILRYDDTDNKPMA